MPITSHCLHCGTLKQPQNYADDYCAGCATARQETTEYITRENTARDAANKKVIEANRINLESGALNPRDLDLKPLLDMSAALREAMLRRAHSTNGSHTDPRAIFNPGLIPASVNNLGMATHIPPTVTVQRGAMAPEVPPGSEGM